MQLGFIQMKPLVTIAIPAYRPEYIATTLRSALGQSYDNIEVLVHDQCPTDAVYNIVQQFPTVKYFRFVDNGISIPSRAIQNFSQAIQKSRGEYVNLLCDDDVLHPFCIEHLLAPLLDNPALSMSFSNRQIIDEENKFKDVLKKIMVEENTEISSRVYYRGLVHRLENLIGETSVGLFRTQNIQYRPNGMIDFFGMDLNIHPDIGIWMLCAQKGPLYFVAEVLSYWRSHPNQDTQTNASRCPERNWRYIVQTAGEQNLVSQKEYMVALKRLVPWFTEVLQRTEIIREHLDWAIAELEKHKASSNR